MTSIDVYVSMDSILIDVCNLESLALYMIWLDIGIFEVSRAFRHRGCTCACGTSESPTLRRNKFRVRLGQRYFDAELPHLAAQLPRNLSDAHCRAHKMAPSP